MDPPSRFGPVPPTDAALLEAFIDGFRVTGPEYWNALGLGTTALYAHTLVYNAKHEGPVVLGGRTFVFRRESFPDPAPAEWYVVDLLNHADEAGASAKKISWRLARAVTAGDFDKGLLRDMASQYGTPETQALIAAACPPF